MTLAPNSNLLFILAFELALTLVCLIGDYFIFDSNQVVHILHKSTHFSERLIRALADNSGN
jgi:hypothetical protein